MGINHFEIKRAQVKTRMMGGRYLLGVEESRYRNTDPTCKLCNAEEEDIAHFLLRCQRGIYEKAEGGPTTIRWGYRDNIPGLGETNTTDS